METKARFKRLWFGLACALALAGSGCFTGPVDKGKQGANVTLNITAFNAGFGLDWLYGLRDVYQNTNKNVKIEIKTTVLPWGVAEQIDGGLGGIDIFMATCDLYGFVDKGSFIGLNDVYAMKPAGEDKTVEEKIFPEYKESLYYKGEWTAMPWAHGVTGMTVNLTTLAKLFPGGYELPRTTDEFIAFAGRIKNAGHYALAFSGGDSYMEYMWRPLWAQYDPEAYAGYFQGRYFDGSEWKNADAGQSLAQPGKLKALQVLETLLKNSNGYAHAYSNSMSFAEMQAAFAGLGYGGFVDNKTVAFCPNGSWLSSEIGHLLIEQAAAGNPQDIRFMKMPILSAVREKCPSVESDAELSALIKAIDAGSGALSGEGYSVTQGDFDRVKRARSLVSENGTGHQAGITNWCPNKDAAKAFLVFLASDAAGRIYANSLNGLLLPYGYVPQDSSSFSPFVQSVYGVMDGAEYLSVYPLALRRNSLFYTRYYNAWSVNLFGGSATAQSIYDDDVVYYTNQWGNYIAGLW
ncbi:MAG: extracellular solute-binding protein [Clostridiales bacterium]|jgi:hypothetical protein|nr:extracellular solute-binding protein [Clostridiales bacterium]